MDLLDTEKVQKILDRCNLTLNELRKMFEKSESGDYNFFSDSDFETDSFLKSLKIAEMLGVDVSDIISLENY